MEEKRIRAEKKLDEWKEESLKEYQQYLYEQERNPQTMRKYMHDIRCFLSFLGEQKLEKEVVVDYKKALAAQYKTASANSMMVALNGYLRYLGREECCVHLLRVQRQIFRDEDKELSTDEYRRLVRWADANGKQRLCCLIQTIGSTGIRVSELRYITVEALKKGSVVINNKGKERCVLLPPSLVELLERYCREENIRTGCIFVTNSGRPIDRRNIWLQMKRLCRDAGVPDTKVFPHNLRHLFARLYYEKEKDIVRLADYLGHSSVETTRRYTMISSREACLKQLELGLLLGSSFGDYFG